MVMHFEAMTVGDGGKPCLSIQNALLRVPREWRVGKRNERAKRPGLAAAVARERREKMATCCVPRLPKDHALSLVSHARPPITCTGIERVVGGLQSLDASALLFLRSIINSNSDHFLSLRTSFSSLNDDFD
jgi:hypothetical protein